MTAAAPARRGTRRLAALVAVLLALLVTACGAIDAVLDTEAALEREGFRNASVDWSGDDTAETLQISWLARAETREGLEEETLRAAGVVWREAPFYFDLLSLVPIDSPLDAFESQRTYTRAQLQQRFGPRPAGLDKSIEEYVDFRAIAVGAGLVVLAGLAVTVTIVVVLVRSSRKRKAARDAQWQPGWQRPQGWQGQQPWPPPGTPPYPGAPPYRPPPQAGGWRSPPPPAPPPTSPPAAPPSGEASWPRPWQPGGPPPGGQGGRLGGPAGGQPGAQPGAQPPSPPTPAAPGAPPAAKPADSGDPWGTPPG